VTKKWSVGGVEVSWLVMVLGVRCERRGDVSLHVETEVAGKRFSGKSNLGIESALNWYVNSQLLGTMTNLVRLIGFVCPTN